MDCFSGGRETRECTASPAPAASAAIAIAARYLILMAMVPPSVPRTNRTSLEMVPGRCLTLTLERLLAPPGIASSSICSSAAVPCDAGKPATLKISDLYKRPLQVWRYLRQFPSPCSPNWSLLRQACLSSPHTSLRTGLWQVSRYLRQRPRKIAPTW